MLVSASLVLASTTPVAWVIETWEYTRQLQQHLSTTWDLKWCGHNGTACIGESQSGVRAVIGEADMINLAGLSELDLVQSVDYFYTDPNAVPLRSAISFADVFPKYGVTSLAEWCIAATFEWLYRLRERSEAFLACAWASDAPSRCGASSAATNHSMFSDLTVGVLGYGHIGKEVAKRAGALGATVVATTVHGPFEPTPAPLKWLSDDNDRLYRESDVVVVTVPESAVSLVNETALKLMRPHSLLVTIVSDPIDFDALYSTLVAQPTRFAVLDVWKEGCYHYPNVTCGRPFGRRNWPSNPEIAMLPNVLPLPGMAMRSATWWTDAIAVVASNLDALVHGTSLAHVVRNASKEV